MPKINNINKRFALLTDLNKQNSSSNVKNIEAISEQISSIKDFLIEGRRLDAKLSRRQNRKSSETEKLITVFKDEIDDIRSKRNKIDTEIQSLLNEDKRQQKIDKKLQDEASTYYSRTGDSELRSGNLVSGLLFSFLGRNEKKKDVLDKENKKTDSDERKKRLDYLETEKTKNDKERQERRDELKTPKKKPAASTSEPVITPTPTASTSEPLSTPKNAIDPSIQDEKYAQKDKEIASPTPIVIQSIIDPVTVEISKISKESLDDLKKLLESAGSKSSGDMVSSLTSLLPLALNPVTLGIVAAAAAIGVFALATKSALDKIDAADKASKEQQAQNLQEYEDRVRKNGGRPLSQEEQNNVINKNGQATRETSQKSGEWASLNDQSNASIEQRNSKVYAAQAEQETSDKIARINLGITDSKDAPTKVLEQWIREDQKKLDTEDKKGFFDAKMGYDAIQDVKKKLEYNKSVLSGRTDQTGATPPTVPPAVQPTPVKPSTGVPTQPTVPPQPTPVKPSTGVPTPPTVPPQPTPGKPSTGVPSTNNLSPSSQAITTQSPTSVTAAAARIAGAETGGNPDLAYGDMFDRKKGKIVNRLGNKLQTAEEYSGGKKLSEMTIQEVQDFQKYRETSQKATGAVGKYQFIPSTLTDLVKNTNMDPKTTLFNEETQNKLNDNFQERNLKILRKKSENLGLGSEISGGMQYMGHYIGAGGASAVMAAAQKSPDQTVEQALLASGLKSPVIPDKNGNLINAELRTTLVKDFENILQARIDKNTPTQESNRTGESGTKLYTAAAVNKDAQQNTGANIVNAPQTNVVNNQNASNKQVREKAADTSNIFQSIYNRLSYGSYA